MARRKYQEVVLMVNPADTNERPKVTRCQIIATDICPECGSTNVRKGPIGLSLGERICRDCLCYWEWPGGRGIQDAIVRYSQAKKWGQLVIKKRGKYKIKVVRNAVLA